MKKIRILASLLSLMMVVCALPMMQASAASPANMPNNLGEAVAKAMNEFNGNEDFKWACPPSSGEVANWTAMNLDFTQDGMEGLEYSTEALDGVTFDSENGMTFPETEGAWRYFPGATNPCGNDANWGPGSDNGYYAYSFKVQEGGNLMSWGAIPWTYNVAHITATPTGVTIKSSNGEGSGVNDDTLVSYTEAGKAYAPGTEWNDVFVHVVNAKSPYQVWMKKQSEASFTKIAEAQFPANVNGNGGSGNLNWGFGNDYTTTKKGLTFIGTSANVGYAVTMKGKSENPFAESIEAILGEATASTYAFDFDENTNLANSTGRTGFTAEGYKSEADGLTLVDPADTVTRFTFAPFGSYSPLNGNTNWNETTYDPQALYVKAKGNFNVLIPAPKIYGRVNMAVEVGKEISVATKTNKFTYGVTIQDEWTEYLIVPNDLTIPSWISDGGYSIYVKADAATNGVWTKVKDCAYENPTTGYGQYGLSFSGVTGNIKSVKTIDLTHSVADSVTAPEGVLYFEEEFDAQPTYSNISTGSVVYEEGNVVFPTTTSSMDLKFTDVVIPVGGYAEFKVQYDGIARYEFNDGENSISVSQQSDYGMVTNGLGYCGNNNTSWRTWRIVRTTEGYNIYSQAEGDTGWMSHSVNAKAASTKAPQVFFNFGTRNGSDPEGTIIPGESKIAYFKVYGPAVDALTLMDGYTTRVLADGDAMIYPEAIRVQVDAEEGKLLVASYNGKVIVDVQVIDVATEMTDGATTLDLTQTSGSSVRFFLWDGYDKIEALADDITLTF